MARDFGAKPVYAELPVAGLAVDSSYQRSIEARRNQGAIERICENFRWPLFGIVTVTKGLSGYLIIDGQHRTEAAKRLKITSVPCLVVPMLSKKDQALAFVAANRDRVAVTSFAIHHALATAGDERSLALEALCAAAEIEIPRYPIPAASMKPGQTLAIGALSSMLDGRGRDRSVELLGALRRAWPQEKGALRAPLISAVTTMDTIRGIDAASLERALKRDGMKAFDKACREMLESGGNSKSRTQAAITVISRLMGIGATAIEIKPVAAKPAAERIAPKPHKPIPVSDGRTKPKVGPTRAEIDSAISSFVAKNGVTKCPPAAVSATTADPGSKFDHEVLTEAQRRARQASGNVRQWRV